MRIARGHGTATVVDARRTALGGLVGGLLLGLVVGDAVMPFIADVYGYEGATDLQVVLGWGLHLLHGLVLGAAFGLLLDHTRLRRLAATPRRRVAAGLAYGLLLWVVGWSLAAPAVMQVTTGWPIAPPDFHGLALVGHVLYGLAVGAAPTLGTPASR